MHDPDEMNPTESPQSLLPARTGEVPPGHSWAPWAGMFKDDPWFEVCRQAIVDRRREIDEDSSIP